MNNSLINQSRNYHSIDVWRFVAMFLVVAIHMPFPEKAGSYVITLGKTAVPFFIVASGFFCYRDDRNEFSHRLVKQIIKLLILSIVCNIFYCIFGFVMSDNINTQSIVNSFCSYLKKSLTQYYIKTFLLVNESPFAGHLWFLGSMVYAMVIVLLLVKTKVFDYVCFASLLLLAVYIAMAYSGKINFVYCRNALFCTMPYFMFGCLFRKYSDLVEKISAWKLFVYAAGFCALSVFELLFHKSTGFVFFGTEFLTVVIFALLVKFKNFGKGSLFEVIGRRDTLFVYIVHFALCYYFWINYRSLTSLMKWLAPVLVFLTSIFLAELFICIKLLFKRIVKK